MKITICTALILLFSLWCSPAYSVFKTAIIRRDGTFVVPPKIGPIESLGDDWFVYSLPNKSGPGNSVYIVQPDGTQRQVSAPNRIEISCGNFEPSIAFVRKGNVPRVVFYCERDNKKGLVDDRGNVVLEPKYGYIGEVAEGHFVACEESYTRQATEKLLVFDDTGNLTGTTEKCFIEGRSKFTGGFAPVCGENNKIAYIDFTGRLVTPYQYSQFDSYPTELLAINKNSAQTTSDGKEPKLDTNVTNTVVLGLLPDATYVKSGIDDAYVTRSISPTGKRHHGVMDKNHNVILPSVYDGIGAVPGGFLARNLGPPQHFYLYDRRGKKVLDFPDNTVDVRIGPEELIGVCVKSASGQNGAAHGSIEKSTKTLDLWGFMDRTGRFVIQPQYLGGVNPFEYGVAMVYVQDELHDLKAGLIDAKGDWVVKPIYDGVSSGKNLFKVIVPEPHFFSADTWKENWDHNSDLFKLFRDKQVIGMTRDELQKQLGQPNHTTTAYSSYIIDFGIDTADLIDFGFNSEGKIYRWRKRPSSFSARVSEDFPDWNNKNEYPP